MLKSSGKYSDVFSLGRIINFIMTGNPLDYHHKFKNIAEKSTTQEINNRYSDADCLLEAFNKTVSYHQNRNNKSRIEEKIKRKLFDSDVETYISEMNNLQLSESLLNNSIDYENVLLKYMNLSDEKAMHIISAINSSYRDVCLGSFSAHDNFSSFAYSVLTGDYSFVVKETAAYILKYVAWVVNRFSAQGLIEKIKENGIDPLLEDILSP